MLDNPSRSYNDYAFYAQDQWSIMPDLNLTFGARYDSPDEFDEEWSFRFAAVKTLENDMFAKFLFGTAFRIPTYREFRKTETDGTELFDPSLSAEHMKTFELAIGKKTKKGNNWLLTGFYNKYKDFISDEYDPVLDDEIFHNYDERVTRGVEFSGNYWLVKDVLDISGGITYTEGHDKVTRDEFHGLSNWVGFLNLRCYPTEKLSFGIIANYVSRPHVDSDYQSESDTQNTSLNDSYIILGANLTYKLNDNTDIQLIGRNITDTEYYSPHYGPSSDYDYEWPGAEFLFVVRTTW
jgi:outer membrane receptor for ferrienterochelin and colicin